MQVIRWFDSASFEQVITLTDSIYKLVCTWNVRASFWSVSLYTADDKPLVVGKKLTIGLDVLASIYDEDKPKGLLLVVPVANDAQEITRDNMGNDVKLIFVSDDELLL